MNTGLHAANLTRQRTVGRVVLRRLNRVEYENTLHDLLAIDLPLQHYLPEDTSLHGFDNVSEGLRLSSLHLEQYLEAADAAIAAATDLRRPPTPVKSRFRYHDEESVIDDAKRPGKKSFRVLPDAVVVFDDNSPTVLHRFRGHERGSYRIRISASAYQAAGRPVWLKLYATDFKTTRLLGYFDLPADEGREVEVTAYLAKGELLELKPANTNYDAKGQVNYNIGADTFAGRGVAIRWVEVEGPRLESWPPPGISRLFGDLKVEPIKQPRPDQQAPAFAIEPKNPRAAVETRSVEFASRAFRRPVMAEEVQHYVKLAHQGLDDGLSFVDAMRVAFRAILMSPRFLFLEEKAGRLDDWALAAPLSYFLWSSMPDEPLRKLAADGTLHDPAILHGQVERMLASPKAQAFVENFVGQWLELRQIDFTMPDKKLYPEFDDILKASMVGETHAFFSQLLRDDGKLRNFIQSDFLMLNRRIAEHYQIPGVAGEEFRRVPVPPGFSSRRRADARQRPQGDGQRHNHLSGHSRRLGDEAAPGRTDTSAAGRHPGIRTRHARGLDDPRAARQAPQSQDLCFVSFPDGPARLCAGELRRDRRVARALSDGTGQFRPTGKRSQNEVSRPGHLGIPARPAC